MQEEQQTSLGQKYPKVLDTLLWTCKGSYLSFCLEIPNSGDECFISSKHHMPLQGLSIMTIHASNPKCFIHDSKTYRKKYSHANQLGASNCS